MPRFQLLDEDELLEFVEGNDSKNTKKQIKYGLSVFLDFCGQTNTNFNNDIDDEALDRLLSQGLCWRSEQKRRLIQQENNASNPV